MFKILKIASFVLTHPGYNLLDRLYFIVSITSPLTLILGIILLFTSSAVPLINMLGKGLIFLSGFVLVYSNIAKGRQFFEKFFLPYYRIFENRNGNKAQQKLHTHLAYLQKYYSAVNMWRLQLSTHIMLLIIPLFLFIFLMAILQNLNVQDYSLWLLLFIGIIAISIFLVILIVRHLWRIHKKFKKEIWSNVEQMRSEHPEIARREKFAAAFVIIIVFIIATLVIYSQYTN